MKDTYFVRTDVRATATVMPLNKFGLYAAHELLPNVPDAPMALVTSINVGGTHRGEGHGSNLLRQITDDADREQVTLMLSVNPDGTGLDRHALETWYTRNGFALIPESEGTAMIRRPRKARD